MDTIIETSKLGPVKVSSHVIAKFNDQSEHGEPAKSAEEVVRVLQSQQIEKFEVPASIALHMAENGDGHLGLEFWVHPDSPMVFLVIPQDSYRLVSMAIKQSIDGFVFGDF